MSTVSSYLCFSRDYPIDNIAIGQASRFSRCRLSLKARVSPQVAPTLWDRVPQLRILTYPDYPIYQEHGKVVPSRVVAQPPELTPIWCDTRVPTASKNKPENRIS